MSWVTHDTQLKTGLTSACTPIFTAFRSHNCNHKKKWLLFLNTSSHWKHLWIIIFSGNTVCRHLSITVCQSELVKIETWHSVRVSPSLWRLRQSNFSVLGWKERFLMCHVAGWFKLSRRLVTTLIMKARAEQGSHGQQEYHSEMKSYICLIYGRWVLNCVERGLPH